MSADDPPPDPQKAATLACENQGRRKRNDRTTDRKLRAYHESVKRRLRFLALHRSHWCGNPAAAISIRLLLQRELRHK